MLNQNEFLASLYNLVVVTRVNSTTNGKRINDLIDACLVDTIEYGEGKMLVSVDTLAVKDYSQTSSILTNSPPTVDEQYLETTDKKYIQLTTNRYLMKGAFANEYSMSEALAMIESMLEKTKDIYMYKKIVNAFATWAPELAPEQASNNTQVVTIDLIDTTNLTGEELTEAQKSNALTIYQKVRELSLNMQSPDRDYNDLKYEEMYNADELEFIVNGKFDSLINTYAYASLLNSDKLDNIQLYEKSIIIPQKQLPTATNETLIGFLASKYKYQIAPRFMVTADFFDGSNLNDQKFLHFWLNSGFARGLACVKLVANFVKEGV